MRVSLLVIRFRLLPNGLEAHLFASNSSRHISIETIQSEYALHKWSSQQSPLFTTLLSRLLLVLRTTDAANMRAKVLRALSAIVAEDQNVFKMESFRQSIEQRLRDAQTSVRDAALDLLGEYIVQRPDLARNYLGQILERSTDTGLSVRKRVLKLLKRLWVTLAGSEQLRLAVCVKVIWRVRDEDAGIKVRSG